MTVQELAKQLDIGIKGFVTTKLPSTINTIVTNDIVNVVRERIRSTGKLADGKVRRYSTKPSLAGYPPKGIQQNYKVMLKKAFTALKKNKANKWVTIKGHRLVEASGGYKQIRTLGGYQSRFKDFSVSNKMLNNVQVKKIIKGGTKLTVIYGAKKSKLQKLIQYHSDREGINIINPSKKELDNYAEKLARALDSYVQRIVEKK